MKTLEIPATERRDYVEWALEKFRPGRVLDLAAGHCKFSIQAAEHAKVRNPGYVYAIDARMERVPDDLPHNVSFQQLNVLTCAWPDVDFIMCLGLFYHLTVDEQEVLLFRLHKAGVPVLLDSHYATERLTWRVAESGQRYKGAPYIEGTEADLMSRLKASATSTESWWHAQDSLQRILNYTFPNITRLAPDSSHNRCFFLLEH